MLGFCYYVGMGSIALSAIILTVLSTCLIIAVALASAIFRGPLLASWIVFCTNTTISVAPYFTTIALSIFSILDPSFALYTSSIFIIQLFLPLFMLHVISYLIARAALSTFLFLAATIACGIVAVLIITTGTWITFATVLLALKRCALSFLAMVKAVPSPKLDFKVELYTMPKIYWTGASLLSQYLHYSIRLGSHTAAENITIDTGYELPICLCYNGVGCCQHGYSCSAARGQTRSGSGVAGPPRE
jgi:hypothetical protein